MRIRLLYIGVVVFSMLALPASAQGPALLLYGGQDHKQFLGCLNCGRFEATSVCNQFGASGSRFSAESIWNRFGSYGSKFSPESPWNKFAGHPPVVVDPQGNFYGYFTSNRAHQKRTEDRTLLSFLDNVDAVNQDLWKARDVFCGN